MRAAAPAACLLLIMLGAAVYWPGLDGPFVFDDLPNITRHTAVAVDELNLDTLHEAATSNGSGPLGRPLSAASFAINHYFAAGFEPRAFKTVNLAVHLANGLLVLLLVRLWLERSPVLRAATPVSAPLTVAAALALAWTLHPIQLTSVLYVVQRMTSLSALFILLGLWLWSLGRLHADAGRPRGFALMVAGLTVGAGLGALAKETALLFPLYALVAELWLMAPAGARRPAAVRAFFALTVAVPAAGGALWLALNPDWLLRGYASRDFTLVERLQTQPRVVMEYIHWVLAPRLRDLGLYHDDIAISRGWLTPSTSLVTALLLALAALLAWRMRGALPLAGFGIAWFLAGHGLESTLLPLEIAHEHRNYLPSLGLLLAVAALLVEGTRAGMPRWIALATTIAAVGLLAALTMQRAGHWADEGTLIDTLVSTHPASARSQSIAGEYALKRLGDRAQAAPHYCAARTLAPQHLEHALRIAALGFDPPCVTTGSRSSIEERLERDRLTPSVQALLTSLVDCTLCERHWCTELERERLSGWLALVAARRDLPPARRELRLAQRAALRVAARPAWCEDAPNPSRNPPRHPPPPR